MSAFSEKMSFVERVQNFVLKLASTIGTQVHFYSESCSSLELALHELKYAYNRYKKSVSHYYDLY